MNLLPQLEQAQVRREYHARLFSVFFFGAAIISLVGVISLLPPYAALSSEKETMKAEIAALERSLAAEDESSAGEFVTAKKEIATLTAGKNTERAADDLLLALAKKESVDGISLTAITYERRETGTSISLGGSAKTRGSLRAFQKALEGEYRFEKVNIPVSNFVKEQDIPFTITIALRGVQPPISP